jgi:hypothetical protein
MCKGIIKRHIEKLPPTQIFTTRDMLIYGSRSAVDSALSKMVEHAFIVRLARGVFVKDASKEPTVLEIAQAKAKTLKTVLKEFPWKILNELDITADRNAAATYAKIGHSGSFGTIHGRVHIKGTSGKKMKLLETAVGQALFALWFRGANLCTSSDLQLLTRWFGRKEKEMLWLFGALMPAWLNAICRDCYPRHPYLVFLDWS